MENKFDEFMTQNPAESQLDTILNLYVAVRALQKKVAKLETKSVDNVEIKTDTGDFASGWNGRRVLNTFDNNYKIYADGAWRTIVAY